MKIKPYFIIKQPRKPNQTEEQKNNKKYAMRGRKNGSVDAKEIVQKILKKTILRHSKNNFKDLSYNVIKQGRPISFATLRISTHAPNLRNYMNPYITKFHYPSPIDGLNVSIEFYN